MVIAYKARCTATLDKEQCTPSFQLAVKKTRMRESPGQYMYFGTLNLKIFMKTLFESLFSEKRRRVAQYECAC